MLKTILLCVLIPLALLWPAILIPARLLLPPCPDGLYTVLLASGSGDRLEQQCRAWLLLRRFGLIRQSLLIVDAGLNAEGQAIAAHLAALSPSIILCDPASGEDE